MVTAQNLRSMFAATNFIRFFFVDFVAIGPERFTCHTHSGLRSEAQAAITLLARLVLYLKNPLPFPAIESHGAGCSRTFLRDTDGLVWLSSEEYPLSQQLSTINYPISGHWPDYIHRIEE